MPTSGGQLEQYAAKVAQWTSVVQGWPGLQEWRAFRNPLQTTPQVMVTQEYETLAACQNWLQSSEYAALVAEMRAVGCSNFAIQVWDTSPIAPNPWRPAKG
jgi:heme-degrading monooxygenase HmoA